MRSLALMIIGGVIATLLGCISKNEDKSTVEVVTNAKNEVDTLIYSNPQSYSKTLESGPDVQNIEVRNYKDLFELYEKLNYTPEAWQSGIREVPRVYLPIIGDRWGSGNSEEVTTDNKKRLFFRTLAPLILRSNELILKDRDRLGEIRSSLKQSNSISKEDQTWIVKLAKVYKVEVKEDEISVERVDELWKKVDIVPVSLALAQAAEESGWGTSRFAALGNAVYGQWTWGSNAIIPEKQRKEKGNYGIASFENLQQSICAYMLNLNTHQAYSSLRDKRAELRRNNEEITGYILAGQLTKYSERGEAYVKALRSLMDFNQLAPADEAYLSSNPIIYLVPVAN